MNKRINFTKANIESIASPDSGRVYLYDLKTPALAICVTASGVKTFYRTGRVAGRPERVRLGSYPELTVEMARRMAARISGDIAEGKDPQGARRLQRQELTLGAVWSHFLENYAVIRLRPRTKEGYVRQWEQHLKQWAGWKLSAITMSKVHALHAGMAATPYMANRVLALLSRLFGYARKPIGWQGANPAASVERFPEQERDRFLDAHDLPAFFEAVAEEPDDTVRDYFLTLLLTGARRSNTAAMRWDQLDLNRAIWTIPASQTKNGRMYRLPLVAAVVEVLRRRQTEVGDSPWVFPGRKRGDHIKEPKGPWKRLLNRAGITDLRLHDLRRTLGSWQAATGASLPVIGKSLGHVTTAATHIYARLSLDPVRDALEIATTAMLKAKDKRKGDVENPPNHRAGKAC